MEKAIMGIKIGMTQIFDENGKIVPVTVVQAGPCTVVQKKNVENDGYNAVQVGFVDIKEKKVSKPLKGHFDKNNVTYKRYLKEFILDNIDNFNVGDEIKADIFKSGDKVDVSGVSKGKGYQGVIKRYGQSRGPMGHGSKYHRGVGALGGASYPSKVFKGKKLAGRMGGKNVTVQNLEIAKVDIEKNLILLKGAVPGPKKGLIVIKDSVKN